MRISNFLLGAGDDISSTRPDQARPGSPQDATLRGKIERWRAPLVIALLALAFPLVFAWHTGQVWEDFFITFRHSRNWAEGHGLVYHPGERVHGFTSPLNVLLPAFAQRLWGGDDFRPALWFFNAIGLAVFAVGIASVAILARRAGSWPRGLAVGFAIVVGLQVKMAAFSVNGQETAFVVGFLALGLVAAHRGFARHWFFNGCCWAGLMWSRPDSPVYIAALAMAGLLCNGQPRAAELRGILRAGLVCTALYLPWFIGTTWYYGSPVPHTVRAKFALFDLPMTATAIGQRMLENVPAMAGRAFEPIYAEAGGWPRGLSWFSRGFALVALVGAFLPGGSRVGRMAAIVFLSGLAYLCYVAATSFAFPWYFTPLSFAGAVAFCAGAATLCSRGRVGKAAVACGVGGVVVIQAWLFGAAMRQGQVQQREIEDNTRTQAGNWLRQHALPGDRVMLEPIGYIGYYSRLHIVDWPGLVAPEVVRLRRERRAGFVDVARELAPEWLVLRPREYRAVVADAELRGRYAVAASVDATERLARHGLVRGSGFLTADSQFLILRRVAATEKKFATDGTDRPGSKHQRFLP